jgi:hypothetical protein
LKNERVGAGGFEKTMGAEPNIIKPTQMAMQTAKRVFEFVADNPVGGVPVFTGPKGYFLCLKSQVLSGLQPNRLSFMVLDERGASLKLIGHATGKIHAQITGSLAGGATACPRIFASGD